MGCLRERSQRHRHVCSALQDRMVQCSQRNAQYTRERDELGIVGSQAAFQRDIDRLVPRHAGDAVSQNDRGEGHPAKDCDSR